MAVKMLEEIKVLTNLPAKAYTQGTSWTNGVASSPVAIDANGYRKAVYSFNIESFTTIASATAALKVSKTTLYADATAAKDSAGANITVTRTTAGTTVVEVDLDAQAGKYLFLDVSFIAGGGGGANAYAGMILGDPLKLPAA